MFIGEGLASGWIIFVVLIIVGVTAVVDSDARTTNAGRSKNLAPTTSYPCSLEDSFRCNPDLDRGDDEARCLPPGARCNGSIECPSGRDESVEICGCLETEFQCNATVCIDLLLRCDRNPDCMDGRDEADCETYVCPVTHIKCDNHACVPRDKQCDFQNDCGDFSDEKICSHRNCFSTEFRCNNSQCISMADLCDGMADCPDAGDEDQAECEKYLKCPMGFYVTDAVICDGWVDCYVTHTDELDCGECGSNQYTCPNNQCILESNVCDGVCDCVSCSDEDSCDSYTCTGDWEYLCQPYEGRPRRCIDKEQVCDMVNDCRNARSGTDEVYCVEDKNCSNFRPQSRTAHMYCPEGRCIPVKTKCDGITDCVNGEDEKDCDFIQCLGSEFTCASGQCIPIDKRCDSTFDCSDRSDEADCASYQCSPSQTRCHSGQCVDKDKWCNFFRDCLDGSDEKGCDRSACAEGEFRCHSGQCVDMKYKCYDGKKGGDLGCVDKSHLFNCSDFQCGQDQFKCKNAYCIDSSQVCDGSVDCKLSYTNWDEENCVYACPYSSKICVCENYMMNCERRALTSVPDLFKVEHFTSLHFSGNRMKIDQTSFSPSYFDKVIYLDLSNNSISSIPGFSFENMFRLTHLSLSHNNITTLDSRAFVGLRSLKALHLYGNQIKTLQNETFLPLINLRALNLDRQNLTKIHANTFRGLRRVLTLNLSHNKIVEISHGAFLGLDDLLSLNLAHNRIKRLNYGVFFGLPSLKSLDLSFNQIQAISSIIFYGLGQIRSLDISSNRITEMQDGVFYHLKKLEQLSTDHYKFCCLANSHVQCLPEADEFSSCEDLMSNQMLRISIWVLGVIALLGNMVVILWRLRDFRGGRVHSFLITNLAIGDLLMGVYLLIIASVDLHYRGVYIIHDEDWRSSELCRFAGFVSTFSSELSVLTLTTITLDRLLCILFPLKRTRLGLKRAVLVMSIIWIFVFLIAITPLFGSEYFEDFYGRSGVCLALHVTPDRPAGWEYSVGVFLVLNFVSFLIIAGSYLWMFTVAKKTRNAVRTAENQNDAAMARRMTIIVMTDFCCWVPIILLGFVSLAGARADNQVYAWIAVFVLPLNSATNPILYTLSTAPFLGNVRKRVTIFRKSFINSINADTKHSYVEDRTSHIYSDRKSPYRQLELIRLRSLNNSTAIACYSRDTYGDSS